LLKKRSKAISMLICLAFLFTMIVPGMALGASADFNYTTQTGIQADTDQNLGFVKIDDIDEVDEIYVEVTLPADVDWPANVDQATIGDYIQIYDGNNNYDVNFITGDNDEYVAAANVAGADFDKLVIKAIFQGLTVDDDAADDIVVSITVRGVEDGVAAWKVSEDCLIGQKGGTEVTVKAGAPKTIQVGSGQKLAKVTFTENVKGAFDEGDKIVMTLPSKVKWDMTEGTVLKGNYGLEATIDDIDGDELTLLITGESTTFEDKFSITGVVKVFPGIDDGDVEVDIESNTDANFDDTTLVLAVVGDSDLTFDVDDTSDDVIYPASYDKELDFFSIDAATDFAEGDQITLTLSEGLRWYEEDFDVANVEVLGFYDDNESVWLEVTADGVDKLKFDGLHVAALPDAPLGDITITVGEDYNGEFVIGAVEAQAEVTADSPVVQTGEVTVEAGDITIVETGKKVFNEGGSYSYSKDAEEEYDEYYFLTLTLPAGVEWADEPTVTINGKEVDVDFINANFYGDEYDWFFRNDDRTLSIIFDEDDFRTSRIDSIVISDILYDLDTRLKESEITVEVGGSLVNYLLGAGDYIVKDLEEDYAPDPVFEVVNAIAEEEGQADTVFTIGSTTYTMNGVEYTMGIAPYISGDRTYLPIRYVAYAMGVAEANVLWDQANQTVTLLKGDKVVQLKVGSTTMLVNGAAVTMDAAPQNVDPGYVCLPIRFVAQAFGANISWDAATQQVSIEM
jgi:hypothetical protein